MKLILALVFVSLVSGLNLNYKFASEENAFNQFKAKHNRSYGSAAEELYHRSIFSNNYLVVQKHNMEAAAGLLSYTRSWNNKFADETISTVAVRLNGYRRDFTKSTNHSLGVTFRAPANVELPEEIDWRKLGAVTEVKDQSACGSCWAFSATGTLEGLNFRKTGKLVSEQQLMDCTRNSKKYEPLQGCNGGYPEIALEYVHKNNGIDTEEAYPYVAYDSFCKFNPEKVGAKDKGFVRVTRFDEEALKAAVATMGPISVAIDSSHASFMCYESGVFYESDCSSVDKELDHAVLLVGYGKDKTTGMDYWLVKNSYGSDWGEEGYIRMARNKSNNCGIATDAVYPLM